MSIWFIVVICLLPIVLFLGWSKKYREQHPDTFGYVLSIIGTFVGVAVGLYFTDLAALKEKKQRTVKVLEASKEEMEWLISRAKMIDTVTDNLSSVQKQKYYYLEMPPFFTETLRSELLAEMLHPKSLEQFNIIRENLLFDVDLLKKDVSSKDVPNLESDLNDYKKQIKESIAVIDKEIELLNGEILQENFEASAKSNLSRLMKE
ncbi:MAG: hypothetical protein EAZ14_07245 [Runella slithyformis]|nr:MAG: hypothetical protein EAZ38_15550 [Cytophagales bacterium]TAG38143.1 MAG: hypothetical protein EAZ32_13295 [Cytophagia bacterium]TAG79575.1 MAG: hypothetical protein EAZ22_11290 [Cytophagales bacterium]TAH10848.1 MAG: hypothetical protein EAZ14_07245 [Runella slithyformis]